jgi:aconitate decarboxylase
VGSTGVTASIAAFVAGLRYEDLPDRVAERTKIVFLDALASAFAGCDADESATVAEVAVDLCGGGDVTVIGGGTASAAAATLINGYLVTAATVCDVHRPTVCHVTPQVVPPAMAVAERRRTSGADFVAAIAAGLEVTTRVGIGTQYDAFRKRGWHSPGVVGPFGGAASAGRVMGLCETRLVNAFGIALSQSAGTWAQLGTPTIKFQQSRGALAGLLAANLAEKGFTATGEALEAEDGGLFTSYADGGEPAAVVRGLGVEWELEEISLRPWPVAAFLQPVVTVALRAMADGPPLEAIESVTLTVGETAYQLHGVMDWADRFKARLSARYVTAVVMTDQACWMDQFTSERVADPKLFAFASGRVTVVKEASCADSSARVNVRYLDGAEAEVVADVPKGDATDPLTFDEVAAKFLRASGRLLSDSVATRTVEMAADLEHLRSVDAMLEALRSKT